jgi:hypothetical protein
MKKKLSVTSFSGALLAQGETLFFPSLDDRGRQEFSSDHADKEDCIHRLTLVAVDRGYRDHLSGGLVGLTLHVQLDVGQFRKLRRSLRQQHRKEKNITFEVELGKEGELEALSINGRALAGSREK